jgi:exoribonuclease R
MSHRVAGAPLDFAALRQELEVPGDFASAVADEAHRAATAPVLPDEDATDIPFVTIDPPGSRDLDQAVHIAREPDGYLVSYAIADPAAFVVPGGAVDVETHRRGETLYFPDRRVPLHPPVLSEDAASLLPDAVRPAVLWRIGLDATGEVRAVDVRRARVRSRAQLDYAGAQRALDEGRAPEAVTALPDVGRARLALARRRQAIDLGLPEQTVEPSPADGWRLTLRRPLPVEAYNAEISLLTGMSAASLMLKAGIGILRTVPPPDERSIASLRRAAHALGVDWPDGAPVGDVLAGLDRGNGRHVALLEHAAMLLRGAAYTTFAGSAPAQPMHAGIGGPYAHVTAPLRRLVDRYGSELCLAAASGQPVPDWVSGALPTLPAEMQRADQLAHRVDRAVVDATEAWLLQDRIGETFAAVVIDADEKSGTVVLDEPAVRAPCDGRLPVGERIRVRLVAADVPTRQVRFEPASGG